MNEELIRLYNRLLIEEDRLKISLSRISSKKAAILMAIEELESFSVSETERFTPKTDRSSYTEIRGQRQLLLFDMDDKSRERSEQHPKVPLPDEHISKERSHGETIHKTIADITEILNKASLVSTEYLSRHLEISPDRVESILREYQNEKWFKNQQNGHWYIKKNDNAQLSDSELKEDKPLLHPVFKIPHTDAFDDFEFFSDVLLYCAESYYPKAIDMNIAIAFLYGDRFEKFDLNLQKKIKKKITNGLSNSLRSPKAGRRLVRGRRIGSFKLKKDEVKS